MSNQKSNKSPPATADSQVTPSVGVNESREITGRAVFAVDTSAAGIVVRTALLSEQGQLLEMPAVFPDLSYALNQIDHLRQIVIDRFAQAAQVGVQVIAAQQQTPPSTVLEEVVPEVDPKPEAQNA